MIMAMAIMDVLLVDQNQHRNKSPSGIYTLEREKNERKMQINANNQLSVLYGNVNEYSNPSTRFACHELHFHTYCIISNICTNMPAKLFVCR